MREFKKCHLSRVCSLLCGMVIVTSAIGCCGGSDDVGVVQFTPGPSGGKGPAGKPGSGSVGADGTFKLSTYGDGDGAVVGKHKVDYAPPVVPIDEATHSENSAPAKGPYDGLVPSKADAEVKAGDNKIDIELVPGPKAG
ncbi:MAG: Uncharacterized protein FD138_1724 [Planctomycetota bacterium]|nr:MAG: Uncharacterized protein FD138_1724 [Planctomycetota bacterium]